MDALKIHFEDKDWVFDISSISANDWKAARNYCGHNPFDLFTAVGDGEIEAVEAMFWLVCRQNHEPPFDFGMRQFGLVAFIEGWNFANQKKLAETDPKASETPGSTSD